MSDLLLMSAKQRVQRLVMGADADCCRQIILKVDDAAGGRKFVVELLKNHLVAGAGPIGEKGKSKWFVNIGFTYRGLQALGLGDEYLSVFDRNSPAFKMGARSRAASHLGDSGASASERWEESFAIDHAHVLISIFADSANELETTEQALRRLSGADQLSGWGKGHEGAHLPLPEGSDRIDDAGKIRFAHFGLRDGIAQPKVKSEAVSQNAKGPFHSAGELLLGYDNDEGFDRWSDCGPEGIAGFFRNGSFAAFRKIAQDEGTLNRYLDAKTAELNKAAPPPAVPITAEFLKAKMCGRWPNGALVKPGDTQQPAEALAPVTDQFNFSKEDRLGEGCPFGSHIRRTNPRDDAVVPSRRRPLFRRGMPYGLKYKEGDDDPDRRGLLGLFFCASLEDQFEHVLAAWVNDNPMGPDNRGRSKDPLVGVHEDGAAAFDIPAGNGAHLQLTGFPPFVTTRGTLYAFFPSLDALGVIAAQKGGSIRPGAQASAAVSGTGPAYGVRSPAHSASAAAMQPGQDTADPDRYCDLVMEGGITSGVIYPMAVAKLATKYRFKNVGGTSIGAFAAAVTAAAEYSRRKGSFQGFDVLAKLPARLAEVVERRSDCVAYGSGVHEKATRLFWMFEPTKETRRLYEIFIASLGGGSWFRKFLAGVWAALKAYSTYAMTGVLVALLVFGAVVAAIVAMATAGVTGGWLLLALGVTAGAGSILFFAAIALLLALSAVSFGIVRDIRVGLVPNGFGLCHGGPVTDSNMTTKPGAEEPKPLTVVLHELVQVIAGRTQPTDPPLTFDDLWSVKGFPPAWLPKSADEKSINLQVYATNLSHGRPYRFPLDESDDMGRLFFKIDEFERYFPTAIIAHLRGHCQQPSDIEPGFLELPGGKLPIVVAARLSLGFPLLVSAVPLYAIDYEKPKDCKGRRRLSKCWFSDGGLCTNFPIHLFDSVVPKWPTFGISLHTRKEDPKVGRVWLPELHYEGRGDLWNRFDGDDQSGSYRFGGEEQLGPFKRFRGFLQGVWLATWRWNDMTMARMPAVRDRVVRVFLEENQGGINIKLSAKEMLYLANYGAQAGEAFLAKFANRKGWDEHRWVRINTLLVALRERVQALGLAIDQSNHARPLKQQIADALSSPPLKDERQPKFSNQKAKELEDLLDALRTLESVFLKAGDFKPYQPQPRPSLRVRHPT